MTPKQLQQRKTAGQASAARRRKNHPRKPDVPQTQAQNVSFLQNLKTNFDAHGVVTGTGADATITRDANGNYVGKRSEDHFNFLAGLADAGMVLHTNKSGAGYAEDQIGRRIPLGASPDATDVYDTHGNLLRHRGT